MGGSRTKAVMAIVLVAAVGGALVTAAVAWVDGAGRASAGEPLPVLGEVPAFELTSQDERRVTREDLRGQVWVAEFMFTSCAGICPMMMRNMQAVHASVKDEPGAEALRLVSITVDPEHDTPEVLRAYAADHGAEGEPWLFLTSDQRDAIWRLSEQGFMLGVQEAPENPLMPINHSGRFVLVDREGRIRGYYSGTTPEGRDALVADLKRLLDQ